MTRTKALGGIAVVVQVAAVLALLLVVGNYLPFGF
jgi:hypothetical protein